MTTNTTTANKTDAKAIKAIEWMIDKAGNMIDSDGAEIPGSVWFVGTLPARMGSQVREYARKNATSRADGSKRAHYNFDLNGKRYVISWGVYYSTQDRMTLAYDPRG